MKMIQEEEVENSKLQGSEKANGGEGAKAGWTVGGKLFGEAPAIQPPGLPTCLLSPFNFLGVWSFFLSGRTPTGSPTSKATAFLRRRLPILGTFLAAVLLAAGCGLGKKYWVPTADQMAEAEKIAKFHVFTAIGDQAGPQAAAGLALDETGLPKEYPIAFTIGGTPYSRYRFKYWGGITKGVQLVHVQYFDPTAIPDWDKVSDASGPFPAYFTVSVDVAARRAVSDSRTPKAP